ncbi:MAG: hypothetical protein ACFE7E_06060 [Candidatus Hodarchaeota archaeon]
MSRERIRRERKRKPKAKYLPKIDLTLLRKVITLLDGYRVNRFMDPTRIGDLVKAGALGHDLQKDWDDLHQVMYDMSRVPANTPKTIKLLKFLNLTEKLSIINIFVTALLIALSFILGISWIVGVIFATIAIPATIGVRAYLYRQVSNEIDKYVEEHPEKFVRKKTWLKQQVQRSIGTLSRYVRQFEREPSNYPFQLYNTDYSGISIVKRPGSIRKGFVVIAKSRKLE